MSNAPSKIRLPKLLLESEAAALLRRSCTHVKRLRLERKLGYYRGRPVTISREDLEIYVARTKQRRVLRKEKSKERLKNRAKGQSETFEYVSASALPRPFTLLTIAEAAIKFGRTPRQIRYLCLRGRIPYIVGRPSLVDETDLGDYFESKRLVALAKIPPAPGTPEFKTLQDRKANEKMARRLRAKAVRRTVDRIFAGLSKGPSNLR